MRLYSTRREYAYAYLVGVDQAKQSVAQRNVTERFVKWLGRYCVKKNNRNDCFFFIMDFEEKKIGRLCRQEKSKMVVMSTNKVHAPCQRQRQDPSTK